MTDAVSRKKLTEHQNGHLSISQLDRLAVFLQTKFGDRPCEMCGSINWSINPSLGSPLLIAHNPEVPFSLNLVAAQPSVVIHCSDCGNTKLFSLEKLGFSLVEAASDDL